MRPRMPEVVCMDSWTMGTPQTGCGDYLAESVWLIYGSTDGNGCGDGAFHSKDYTLPKRARGDGAFHPDWDQYEDDERPEGWYGHETND